MPSFEPDIHLLPIGLIEPADAKLNGFRAKREELVEVFLGAYPRLCAEAANRLRTLVPAVDRRALLALFAAGTLAAGSDINYTPVV